jgi:hypothetical protein
MGRGRTRIKTQNANGGKREKLSTRHLCFVLVAFSVHICANRNAIARANCHSNTFADTNINQHSHPNGNADHYTYCDPDCDTYSDIYAFWCHFL